MNLDQRLAEQRAVFFEWLVITLVLFSRRQGRRTRLFGGKAGGKEVQLSINTFRSSDLGSIG